MITYLLVLLIHQNILKQLNVNISFLKYEVSELLLLDDD